MRRRGISLIEAMLAAALAALTFFVFMTVFRSSYQQASMSRNRAVAVILARSLMDEIEAHPYGTKAPESWSRAEESPVVVVVQGKPVEMKFTKKIEYRNGSFVDGSHGGTSDVVTLTIRWKEGTGDDQRPKPSPTRSTSADPGGTPAPAPSPAETTKELVVRVPVWR